MASDNVIADISQTLIDRLKTGMADLVENQTQIALITPELKADFSVGLLLYEINRLDWGLLGSAYHKRKKGLALALNYMLCTFSAKEPYVKAQDEQRLLGRAIALMAANPAIIKSNNYLNETDLNITIQMINLSLDDKIKLYSSSGGMKTAVFYQVAPVFIDGAEASLPRVTQLG